MATQDSSVRRLIVGLRSAGRSARIASSLDFSMLSLRPTLLLASSADVRSNAMFSIFLRLAGFSQETLLAIYTVLVLRSVTTMRS